jgi:coenzyme F420-reducing hydrogenase alpha subunit
MRLHPQIAKDGIQLRAFGQSIIEDLGGKKVHPVGIIPGGVTHKLELHTKEKILSQIPHAIEIAQIALKYFTDNLHKFKDELARLNIAKSCGTPVLNSFYYHYARLIEIIHAIEKIKELLNDPKTLSEDISAYAKVNQNKGVGCAEAPRGTLFHDYTVTNDGIITAVNLIIATGNNNLAMNAGVKQAAQKFIDSKNITDGALNRVEALVLMLSLN